MPIFRVTATQDEEQAWNIARGDVGPDPQWQPEPEECWKSDWTLEDIEKMKE